MENNSNKLIKVVLILAVLLGALYYYVVFLPRKEEARLRQQKQEQLAKEERERQALKRQKQKQLTKEERERQAQKQKVPKRKSGSRNILRGMVLIPAGEFLMGSPDGTGNPEERPAHGVHLDAFRIDRTEVTVDDYRAFCKSTGHRMPNQPDWNQDDHPVVNVNWDDAGKYCKWAGKRLPTEAEWEKAARGSDGGKYPWGNESVTGARVNYCDVNCEQSWKNKLQDDGYTYTSPVGTYLEGASPYGVLDMAGNAWEWVSDWYDEGYYKRSPNRNPNGPSSGTARVTRGGSWYIIIVDYLRSTYRNRLSPGTRNFTQGFRCAASGQ